MSQSTFTYSLPTDAVNQIVGWARQAGQIALGYFNNVEFQRKADNSFLTQADLEIEQFLVERFRTTFPEHGLIGEEGARGEMDQSSPFVWTIDPIDGTTSFVQGLPGWGISIGLLVQGQPSFGLFYMPHTDDLTYTPDSNRVISRGRDLQPAIRSDWAAKGFLATSSTAFREFEISVPRLRTMGSVSANLLCLARGAATAVFIAKAHLWDLVAGAAILSRMGGELRYLSGPAINYLQLLDGRLIPEPIIAGHPDLLPELQGAIRPRWGVGIFE